MFGAIPSTWTPPTPVSDVLKRRSEAVADSQPETASRVNDRRLRSMAMLDVAPPDEQLVLASGRGRLALVVTVAASGMASLDATVVNVALPSTGDDLHAGSARCSGCSRGTCWRWPR